MTTSNKQAMKPTTSTRAHMEHPMTASPRAVAQIIEPEPVTEGAGVHLKRSIATRRLNYLDPFLLLDHFASTNPADYEAGFPLHPHRGIETVTYMLRGEVKHRDTLGSSGSIGAGDVQWMTAGRGIMHEEMPQVRPEGIAGFQLWVNLPAKLKMTPARYQDVRSASIPEVERKGGVRVRVITGTVDGVSGPVAGIAADPIYLDVSMPAGASFVQPIELGHQAFAYLFEGEASFGGDDKTNGTRVVSPRLVVLGDGDHVKVTTDKSPARFLLVSGRPLGEPIARYGPFVMNTAEEIEQTLEELRQGTFITT
jgi:redox-sensitive bicupin YhaK (pirin superfamily)